MPNAAAQPSQGRSAYAENHLYALTALAVSEEWTIVFARAAPLARQSSSLVKHIMPWARARWYFLPVSLSIGSTCQMTSDHNIHKRIQCLAWLELHHRNPHQLQVNWLTLVQTGNQVSPMAIWKDAYVSLSYGHCKAGPEMR